MSPKVSIIIPLYNRESLVGETLQSVINQTYPDWECIVVDDGSTDRSLEVAREFALKDGRIKVFSRPLDRERGGNAARNYGFEQSSGAYVNWFDSDDIMAPDFIRLKLECFEKNGFPDAVISKRMVFMDTPENIISREDRTSITANPLTDFLLIRTSWFLPDVMWKKDYVAGKEVFNENLFSGQDRDFHIRMLLYKPNIVVCDHYLTLCRQHAQNITTNLNRDKRLKTSHLIAMDGLLRDLGSRGLLTPEIKKFYFWRTVKYLPYIDKEHHPQLMASLKLLHVNTPIIYWQWLRFYLAKTSYALIGKGYFLLR
jgi:glycosyltransferase involved in cell wall biosynthesis